MRDTREFQDFYQEHLKRVFRFVYFRCGQNRTVAEDLTSEIFLKIARAFDEYDAAISKTAWLMTIARNHLINYWRDQKTTISLDEESEDIDEAADPDRLLLSHSLRAGERTEITRELSQLLLDLPAKDRSLVTLHYLDGYNYKEIAELKGLSETATKVAVHRALKRLRQSL